MKLILINVFFNSLYPKYYISTCNQYKMINEIFYFLKIWCLQIWAHILYLSYVSVQTNHISSTQKSHAADGYCFGNSCRWGNRGSESVGYFL